MTDPMNEGAVSEAVPGRDSKRIVSRRRFVSAIIAGIATAGCTGDDGATGTETGTATVTDTPTSTTEGTEVDETPSVTDTEPSPTDEITPTVTQTDTETEQKADSWMPPTEAPSLDAVSVTTVLSGLEIPWDLTFAGSDAFFTERQNGVYRIDAASLKTGSDLGLADADQILRTSDLPDYDDSPFGGVQGITTHPAYPETKQIFFYYPYNRGTPYNRVVGYDLDADEITPMVDQIPGTKWHHGGRVRIGPDGHLWITTGDAVSPNLVQDPTTLAGATLRMAVDGSIPPDNPEWDQEADDRTYSIGHRNPQGLAFTPDGEVLVSEHGPSGRDEVAVVRGGSNYGWDIVRGGPDDREYESYTEYDRFTPPVINTSPDGTWAPSGITFYDDSAIEPWQNRLFVAGLYSETLFAVSLVRDADAIDRYDQTDATVYDQPWLDDAYTAIVYPLFEERFGRLRHANQGPDGSIYLLTSNRDGEAQRPFPKAEDDRIVRIDPA